MAQPTATTSSSARRNAAARRLALLLLLFPAVAASQSQADSWSSVRDTVRAFMSQANVPSVSIAVARRGKIVW
jgi:CubicO group peptidase (beta-lactamase class C family)